MKLLLIFLISSMASGLRGEEIIITGPKGGWRNSSSSKVNFLQPVTYPDSSVSTGDNQSAMGIIEGKIIGEIKSHSKPYTMVVNGNAMPLEVNGNFFKRPYSFTKGSNTVRILSPDRSTESSVQFFDSGKGSLLSRIRITLSWDSDGTDLDLHVITPAGEHCSYSNRVLIDGSALDIDVTTGYGPEIFASPGAAKGPYLIYVNYFGREGSEDITTATINVITQEGTIDEKVEILRVPLRRPGELVHVHTFNFY